MSDTAACEREREARGCSVFVALTSLTDQVTSAPAITNSAAPFEICGCAATDRDIRPTPGAVHVITNRSGHAFAGVTLVTIVAKCAEAIRPTVLAESSRTIRSVLMLNMPATRRQGARSRVAESVPLVCTHASVKHKESS